jgi:hypothetical protein
MSMYLLAYHGGSLPEDDEEKASATSAWNAWYERLGEAVVDAGNPIARIATIFADGSASEHGTVDPVSGYTILEARDMEAAIEMARGCPNLASGGWIEVGETLEVM